MNMRGTNCGERGLFFCLIRRTAKQTQEKEKVSKKMFITNPSYRVPPPLVKT